MTELTFWYSWTGNIQENNIELTELFNETVGKEKGIHVTAEYQGTYDELHQDREESRKGSIELDDASMNALLKKQQSRYKVMVKEIKAKKLQKNPNDLFDEIKQANDDVVALFKKVRWEPIKHTVSKTLTDICVETEETEKKETVQ